MENLDIISRFNRGLAFSLRRIPLVVSAISLTLAALSYQFVFLLYTLLPSNWHYLSLHGVAIALSTFWIFIGMGINVRYGMARQNQQSLTLELLSPSNRYTVRQALSFSNLFLFGALALWAGLSLKHLFLQIPYLGLILSIILAPLPFFMLLLLKVAPFILAGFLYLLVPVICSEPLHLKSACLRVLRLVRMKPIQSLLCILAGLLPLILAAWLVSSLQRHTLIYLGNDDPVWVLALRRLMLALASASVMAPSIALLAHWGLESMQWLEQK